MGADGGVVWVPVKDPTKYDRAMELLRPFYHLTTTSGMCSTAEDGWYEWCGANPRIAPPHYVVGLYGDFWHDTTLDDLARERECPEPLRGFTWADVAELGFHTMTEKDLAWPDMWCAFVLKLMHEHFGHLEWPEVVNRLGTIATMQVDDWFAELDALLRYDAMKTAETWS